MKKIVTSLLAVVLSAQIVFGQDLNQKISYESKNKNLSTILSDWEKSYQLSFSYLNNELPSEKMQVTFTDVSMKDALTELLHPLDLQHQILNGKIIVKKKTSTTAEVLESVETVEEVESVADTSKQGTLKASPAANNEAVESNSAAPDSLISHQRDLTKSEQLSADPSDSTAAIKQPVAHRNQAQTEDAFTPKITLVGKDSLTIPVIRRSDSIAQNEATDTTYVDEESLKNNLFHFGMFYPFSSNGYMAGQYTNKFSLHFIAGYSGGLTGFELSGVTSITKGDMSGLQLAGITNIVTGKTTGAQISGIANISKQEVAGAQIAGVVNVAEKDILGAQLSGVANVSQGYETGFQASGGVNVAAGKVNFGQVSGLVNVADEISGPQFSGFINVQKNQGSGIQIAGFMNQANNIKGGQISGFINKARDIDGAQIAPFVNVARKVKGSQLGLINISEYMEGTPIGLLSIVKRNGYYDLELFYAEDFQANAIIKLGSQRFHNLFAFAYETDYKNRWAYGYGFGSQWGKRGIRVNTDLLTYYVVENEFPEGAFTDYHLNILSKFRLLLGFHIGEFGIFGGPTFNMMTSRYQDLETGQIGSDIAPETLWEATDDSGTNIKLWIGYNLGIRF